MSEGEAASSCYQVLEELGSGSFGVVYKAIERSTGQIVAIKHVSFSIPCVNRPPKSSLDRSRIQRGRYTGNTARDISPKHMR